MESVQPVPKQSNFLVILLSILLIISCLIAGFSAYQTQKLVKQLRVMGDELKPTPATTQTPTPTIPSKFKQSYTNKEFTLEFPTECTQGEKFIECKKDNLNISIDTRLSGVGTSGRDEIKIINLNGTEWERFSINAPNPLFSAYAYIDDLNGNASNYFIAVNYSQFSLEAQSYFEKILSTFKFIEPVASSSPLPVACTMEAKICPDGSSVERNGPKCEFAPCPETSR
ncbi:MAG: hypothetical protein AAB778_00625 [Patescibacteria group bacterium]